MMTPPHDDAARALDAIARLLAHDLRTPLGPLILAVSSLAEDPTLDAGARSMARIALAQCDRMTRLLQASLWAVRAPEVHAGTVDLGAAVRAAVRAIEEMGGSCEARILGDVRARGDAPRVRDALAGLIEVAAGTRGRAEAAVRLEGGNALVAITGDEPIAEPPLGVPADARAALLHGARAVLEACGGGLRLGEEVVAWLPAA